MLYKPSSTNGTFDKIKRMTFKDFAGFEQLEKNLEALIATNLFARLCPEFLALNFSQDLALVWARSTSKEFKI